MPSPGCSNGKLPICSEREPQGGRPLAVFLRLPEPANSYSRAVNGRGRPNSCTMPRGRRIVTVVAGRSTYLVSDGQRFTAINYSPNSPPRFKLLRREVILKRL